MSTRRSRTSKFSERDRRRCYLPCIDLFEERLLLASFTVTSAADTMAGQGNCGTLRYVIGQLDSMHETSNTISFSIESGPQTITVQGSPLPQITAPVVIDGTTQPDYSNTPLIQINAGENLFGNGLTLAVGSTFSTIRGLSITGFSNGAGIDIESSGFNTVEGNYLGVDPNEHPIPNLNGLVIVNGIGNTIGGTTVAARNVISGNASDGISLTNSSDNMILGNRIGTDITGTMIIGEVTSNNVVNGNGGNGINIVGASDGIIIGMPGAGNVISGNNGNGIVITNSASGDDVQGNMIGTDANGLYALPNAGDGIQLTKVENITIGGTMSGARNLISGNYGSGISFSGTSQFADVQGNFIGTDESGLHALPNNLPSSNPAGNPSGNLGYGIFLSTSSFNNIIGGSDVLNSDGTITTLSGNVISGNFGSGIFFATNSNTNTILGNLIGTDVLGQHAVPNGGDGISTSSSVLKNTIGGSNVLNPDGTIMTLSGNVISGNSGSGIRLGAGAQTNLLEGNFIGTNLAGTLALPNGLDGVTIISVNAVHDMQVMLSGYNTIGGTTPATRNVISGNEQNGISIDSSSGILIEGNSIGIGISGSGRLPNMASGVAVSNSGNITIGATTTVSGSIISGGGNTISGNVQSGIAIQSSTGILVAGNLIGTNGSGTSAIPNTGFGIAVNNSMPNSMPNTIGGSNVVNAEGTLTTLNGNVISGNAAGGIQLTLSSGTLIEGNLIGTDITGQKSVSNLVGVFIFDSTSNTVGSTVAAARNVISGNISYGVEIAGPSPPSSAGNQVLGNLIGPGAGGTSFPVNGQNPDLWYQADTPWLQQVGVVITNSVGNTVGGSTTGSANVISGNNTGIEISGYSNSSLNSSNSSNAIMGNSIGVTPAETNIGNITGIWLNNVPSNIIGGVVAGAGNTISGNSQEGVFIIGANATNTRVQGNTISGLGADGQSYYPDQEKSATFQFPIGVYIQDASSNTIGGAVKGAANTISGNSVGVYILGTSGSSQGNTISGNVINSRAHIKSERYGVLLFNAPNNTTSPNNFGYSGIAKFREFSSPSAKRQNSSSGRGSSTKAKKPAHRPKQAAQRSARRTVPLAATIHGRQVPAGPIQKPHAQVTR